eukprot:211604-Rhodomonas_salina.4
MDAIWMKRRTTDTAGNFSPNTISIPIQQDTTSTIATTVTKRPCRPHSTKKVPPMTNQPGSGSWHSRPRRPRVHSNSGPPLQLVSSHSRKCHPSHSRAPPKTAHSLSPQNPSAGYGAVVPPSHMPPNTHGRQAWPGPCSE